MTEEAIEKIKENLKTKETKLYLWSSKITGKEKEIELLAECTHLHILDLRNNQTQDISFLSNLSNLQMLILRNSQIQDIDALQHLTGLQILDLRNNKLSDCSFLKELSNLKWLILPDNQIQDISFVEKLSNLTVLYLSDNQIQDISFVEKLSNLTVLYLSDNQITAFTLEFLNNFPKLEELYLYGNPIQNIPKDRLGEDKLTNVLVEVRDYLESITKGSRELNEAKLNIVGVGEVGKSEITDALSKLDYKFDENRQTTSGIRIKTWEFPVVDGLKSYDFRANIWDFAGQKENYNTHQFFLAKNSLNLFVWENRVGEENTKFDYWLNIVSLLSENAPIFVVQNKIDIYEKEINRGDWQTKFSNIINFYKTSCKTGQGIEELREAIQREILKLPNTKELWNPDRFKVREILENHKEEYIELKEYIQLCKENNLTKEQAFFLSERLHQLGIILHFSDDFHLKNTIVLKSEWAIDVAYCLVDTKKVKAGSFLKKDLVNIWNDERFEYKQDFLLELMKKFELIFQFQGSDTYIVPEGLPAEAKEEVQDFIPEDQTKELRFEYHYDFMPEGILSRLICRLHHHIKKDWFWKNGVILVYQNTEARIILSDAQSRIKIELWGQNPESLLLIIRSNIEYIHKTLKNPPLEEVIPCYCEKCKPETKETHFFEYEYLKMCLEEGDTELRCSNRTKVSIKKLLEGIQDTKYGAIEIFLRENIEKYKGTVYETPLKQKLEEYERWKMAKFKGDITAVNVLDKETEIRRGVDKILAEA